MKKTEPHSTDIASLAFWFAALFAFIVLSPTLHASEKVSAATAPDAQSQPDLFGHLNWRLAGPFRGGWTEMTVGIPTQPDTFYFGAAGGGVWRTDNAGRTWSALWNQGATAPVGAIAIAASDPETIYIGTGQPEPRYDVASGAGVFKSADGGKTWTALGLEQTQSVGKIWVHPNDANTVLVGALGHFFGPNSERGIFRSTDGGKSWTHVLKINDDTGVVDIVSDPANPDTLFAAAWQARQYPWQSYFTQIGGPGSGLYKSMDGGKSWERLQAQGWPAGNLGRISLASARTSTGTGNSTGLRLYATISVPEAGGLYRSDDGGGNWQRVNSEPAISGYYASRITVAPDDADVVYTVGQSVRRCSEGGKTCTLLRGAPGGDDFHHVWINPLHPDHFAASSDQGTIISVDGGKSWSSWHNQPTGQFYHLAADNRYPYWIYSGQQDSGTVGIASRSDFGALTMRDWHPVGGDERDVDIPDPQDPNIVYASGLGGRVSRFDASTAQVSDISPWPVPNYGKRQTESTHHFAWVTPMAISRTGPVTLYEGAEVLFASKDRGAHWDIISPDLTGKSQQASHCGGDVAIAHARTCGYGSIWSIAPSARHAGEIWVGTDDGLIQQTRDGGAHWKNVTPPNLPEWIKVSAIDVSEREDGVAYVALDGHRIDDLQPHVMATRDFGAHWSDVSSDLPKSHFVSVVRSDPKRSGLLYAGTDIGVFVSLDDGAHWSALQHNLPTALVNDLLVHDNDLIAATQGRAIWILDNVDALRSMQPQQLTRQSVSLFKPADAVRVRANHNRDTPLPQEEPMGQNPPAASIDYWLGRGASGEVKIEIVDAAGTTVQTLSSRPAALPEAERYFSDAWIKPAAALSTQPGMHRAIWNLRYARPAAIGYDYSIAATPWVDTPLKPEGMLVLPGTYRIRLTVDGQAQESVLRVVQDPRSKASDSAMQQGLTLSRFIALRLAKARQGYGEMTLVRNQINETLETLRSKHAPTDALAVQLKTLQTIDQEPGLKKCSSALGKIESDLEDTDSAPTGSQRQVAHDYASQIDQIWSGWSRFRGSLVKSLNRVRAASGMTPVVIPAPNQLEIEPDESGEDLP